MLDVHPPHEKIHGFRDFLLHLVTITIGLLIALGLEGCVEWNHHRNLRNEADANLRQEITANQKDLAAVRDAFGDEEKQLAAIAEKLKQRQQGKEVDHHPAQLGMKITTLQDVSWKTATSTGALGYMDYSQVKRYAEAYQLQDQFVQIQNGIVDRMPDMLSATTGQIWAISPADAGVALVEVRKAMTHLEAMREIGEALDGVYTKTLKGE
jgi:hypothetical protein